MNAFQRIVVFLVLVALGGLFVAFTGNLPPVDWRLPVEEKFLPEVIKHALWLGGFAGSVLCFGGALFMLFSSPTRRR
jgi:hypothetical protein